MSLGGIIRVSRKGGGGFILKETAWQCVDMAMKPLVRARRAISLALSIKLENGSLTLDYLQFQHSMPDCQLEQVSIAQVT